MYVVDITRDYNDTDILCGKDSMDAKAKTINYIMDYVLVNCNLSLDREWLDQNLDINRFSLNEFLSNNYSMVMDRDLLIQSIPCDKEHCLFLKYSDGKEDFPILRSFQNREMKYAQSLMRFLVNDALIEKYQNNLSEYERLKLKEDELILNTSYPKVNINCSIIPLYDKKLLLDELLNSNCSYNQLINYDIKI